MHFTAFDDGDSLAKWLAGHVAKTLSAAIQQKGKASLAVSGGSTPIRFFKTLSHEELDWKNVSITLVDDRCVPTSSLRSNQRLVTLDLLQGAAAQASFTGLYRDGKNADRLDKIEAGLRPLLPIDVLVLGMGTDGHTASLFPGGDNLQEATNAATKKIVIHMNAPATEEKRITLTAPVLWSATEIVLHIEGAKKREVLDAALAAGDPAVMPIRYILQKRPDLRVVWAP